MDRAELPPLKAAIWGSDGGCTGWLGMSRAYPETEENEDAKEGTAGHEVGSDVIASMLKGVPKRPHDYIGKTMGNGVVITKDVAEAVAVYTDHFLNTVNGSGIWPLDTKTLGIEERVHMPQIHPNNWGTLDARLYDWRGRTLYLWDLKLGRDPVTAFENWQLIDYCNGVLEKLGLHQDIHLKVVLIVVQPRATGAKRPIRQWATTVGELRSYFNILHTNAHLNTNGNGWLNTGKHCRNCQARYACPAAREAGVAMFEASLKPLPVDITNDELAYWYKFLQRANEHIGSLFKGVATQMDVKLRGGETVGPYSIVHGNGNRKWKAPEKANRVAELMGISLEVTDLCTPAEAERRGLPTQLVNKYTEQPKTKGKIKEFDRAEIKEELSRW